jgi:hypothetical protein
MGAHRLFRHPSQYWRPSGTPVGADAEARNLALPNQLVNCRRVNVEQFAYFFDRQDFLIVCQRVYDASLFKIVGK